MVGMNVGLHSLKKKSIYYWVDLGALRGVKIEVKRSEKRVLREVEKEGHKRSGKRRFKRS